MSRPGQFKMYILCTFTFVRKSKINLHVCQIYSTIPSQSPKKEKNKQQQRTKKQWDQIDGNTLMGRFNNDKQTTITQNKQPTTNKQTN